MLKRHALEPHNASTIWIISEVCCPPSCEMDTCQYGQRWHCMVFLAVDTVWILPQGSWDMYEWSDPTGGNMC